MTAPLKVLGEAAHVTAARKNLQAAWHGRARWSRTDSARYLNDRSEAFLALLRRRPGAWPRHTHQLGYWLRTHTPPVFDRAHAALARALDDAARKELLPTDLV